MPIERSAGKLRVVIDTNVLFYRDRRRLQPLGRYRGIEIVSPAAFLSLP